MKGVAGQDFMAHYVFVEAETNPQTAPVTIWQQGGPGCSGFGAGYDHVLMPTRPYDFTSFLSIILQCLFG